MFNRLSEFFEADNGRKSMPRLAVFCTLPFSSYVVVMEPDQLVNYLSAYVVCYGLGKAADAAADIFKGGNDAVASSESQTTIVQSSSTVTQPDGVEDKRLAAKSIPTRSSKSRSRKRN